MTYLESLVREHRELDYIVENADKNTFLSDWNCEHPYYKESFSNLKGAKRNIQDYNYIRANDRLTELISLFHKKSDNVCYDPNEILTSNGSTTIISAFFIWLKTNNIKQVYYIPPVYFTFHYFSKIYGISLRPITKSHLFETKYSINLPETQSILLLTDPIWYAGVALPNSLYELLLNWQQLTKSTIIVDGSFQSFKWNSSKFENACQLDKSRTFRLVCPTKAIATHGFRFSYLLLPREYYDSFDYILDNLCGSSSAYDSLLSEKCMSLLNSKKSNSELINYTVGQYQKLLINKSISNVISPDCGYFIFAKISKRHKNKFQLMDGKYFEQKKYEHHVRINLLSPAVQNFLNSA